MPVDMHEYKVLLALRRLPRFEPAGEISRETRAIDFPAWRALFASLAVPTGPGLGIDVDVDEDALRHLDARVRG